MLRGVAGALRDSSAVLSVVVRNQAGEVLKSAIQAGDLAATENNLTAEWGLESLYGGRVRLFGVRQPPTYVESGVAGNAAERGVRVIADYAAKDFSQR